MAEGKIYSQFFSSGTPWRILEDETNGNVQFVILADPITGDPLTHVPVRIYGEHYNSTGSEVVQHPILTDPFGVILVKQWDHHHAEEGRQFETCHSTTSLTGSGNLDLLIVSATNGESHLEIVEIVTDVDCYIEFYKGTTTSAAGSATTSGPSCVHLASSNTSGTAITVGPTVTSTGTLMSKRLILAGRSMVSVSRGSGEWPLGLAGAKHLLRITNLANTTGKVGITLRHYEHGTAALESRGI